MSTGDFARYGDVVGRLVGEPLSLTLAINSIKLMVRAARHEDDFIWIEPPWLLLRGGAEVASSADYPPHDSSDCSERAQAWRALVAPLLQGAVLEGVTAAPDGSALFRFQGAMLLHAGLGDPTDAAPWYDDWFAKSRRTTSCS